MLSRVGKRRYFLQVFASFSSLPSVSIYCSNLQERLKLPNEMLKDEHLQIDDAGLILFDTPKGLSLRLGEMNPFSRTEAPWKIDFNDYKRRVKNVHSELIVSSVNHCNHSHTVIDLTAGLGRDGFLLASANMNVILIERNIVLYSLLHDAIERLRLQENISDSSNSIGRRMTVIHDDSTELDTEKLLSKALAISPSISRLSVYLDPMYPSKSVGRKSNVKKETQMLHRLVGIGKRCENEIQNENNKLMLQAQILLKNSRLKGKIVVKRPLGAKPITDLMPSSTIKGSSQRFDIYHSS